MKGGSFRDSFREFIVSFTRREAHIMGFRGNGAHSLHWVSEIGRHHHRALADLDFARAINHLPPRKNETIARVIHLNKLIIANELANSCLPDPHSLKIFNIQYSID